jgi:hypothetical protein
LPNGWLTTERAGKKMLKNNVQNRCKQIRLRLQRVLTGGLNFNTGWLQNHIAKCPRCQRRISRFGRVDLAFSLLKSQPHSLDLLSRANTKAIGVLKHSLRNAPGTEKLRNMRPEPAWPLRHAGCIRAVLNAAACIVVVILLKTTTFSSMKNFHDESSAHVKNYYANRLGSEIADDIFSA